MHMYACNARLLLVASLTNNSFKDRRLASQITTSLSGMLRPRSHSAQETFQKVIHRKIAPQQTHLTVKFLRVDFPKRKVHI